jgi:hypothetical protein
MEEIYGVALKRWSGVAHSGARYVLAVLPPSWFLIAASGGPSAKYRAPHGFRSIVRAPRSSLFFRKLMETDTRESESASVLGQAVLAHMQNAAP